MLSSMRYCKKSIIILLFIVFTQILMVNFSFASPVPVFYMMSRDNHNEKWGDVFQNVSKIYEMDPSFNKLKIYSFYGDDIYEMDPSFNKLKIYSFYGDDIYEMDTSFNKLKIYSFY